MIRLLYSGVKIGTILQHWWTLEQLPHGSQQIRKYCLLDSDMLIINLNTIIADSCDNTGILYLGVRE